MQVTNLFSTGDDLFRAASAANVLLAEGLVVKVTDLGMSHKDSDARAHQALAQAGTPVYHSAEVLMGLGCSTATDIYALG
jgi:serine/threonine protein kinase